MAPRTPRLKKSTTPSSGQSNTPPQSALSSKTHGAGNLIALLKANPDCPVCMIVGPDFVRRERASRIVLRHWAETAGVRLSQGRDHAESFAVATKLGQQTSEHRDTTSATSTKDRPAASIHTLSGSELSSSEISRLSDSARSMDLFSPFQVSWIRDVDLSNASTAGDLGKIVGKFSSAHKLLLSAKELNAKHPLRAQVAAQGFVVDLESLKNYELRRWLEKELRRLGISPRDEEALVSLLSAGEESPDRLASMSEQLACFCSEATFSVSDVAQLFVFHAIPGEFEFLDSLVAGNTKRCELMLTELLLTGKSAFMLLALISRSFSNYLAVRLLLDERASPQDIRQKLGLSPWVYNKAVAAGQRYSAGQLVEVMQTLVRIDSRLKNRSLGPDALLSELVLNLGASQKASKSRRPAWPSPLPI